jgi:hypothetical protein
MLTSTNTWRKPEEKQGEKQSSSMATTTTSNIASTAQQLRRPELSKTREWR